MSTRRSGSKSSPTGAGELSRRRALKVMATSAAGAWLLPACAPGDAGGEGGGSTGGGVTGGAIADAFQVPARETYPFELPPLPYPLQALEVAVDARTMEIHHGRHHQGYTNKLNTALADHADLQGRSITDLISNLTDLPEAVRTGVRNAGGGYLNHALFWPSMGPDGGGQPTGALSAKIDSTFGSFSGFTEKFAAAAKGQFGSGWAWLASDPAGALSIRATANQDSPLTQGFFPLLGLDVWEHAYYLRYQNRRADYIENFWKVVRWSFVARQYGA